MSESFFPSLYQLNMLNWKYISWYYSFIKDI